MKGPYVLWAVMRWGIFAGLILVTLSGFGVCLLVLQTVSDLPKLPEDLSRIIETPQSLVYNASGKVVLHLGERENVPLNRVSPDFINAIVATEDHLFSSIEVSTSFGH